MSVSHVNGHQGRSFRRSLWLEAEAVLSFMRRSKTRSQSLDHRGPTSKEARHDRGSYEQSGEIVLHRARAPSHAGFNHGSDLPGVQGSAAGLNGYLMVF